MPCVDRNQRGGPGVILAPHHLHKRAGAGPVGPIGGAAEPRQNQIAVLQVPRAGVNEQNPVFRTPINRLQPDFASRFTDDAQNALSAPAESLDQPRQAFAILQDLKSHQKPIAQTRRPRRGLVGPWRETELWRGGRRLDQPNPKLAIGVLLDHIGYAYGGDFNRTIFKPRPGGVPPFSVRFEGRRHLANPRGRAVRDPPHDAFFFGPALRAGVLGPLSLAALRAPGLVLPLFPSRASRRATASSSVTAAGSTPRGTLALTASCLM